MKNDEDIIINMHNITYKVGQRFLLKDITWQIRRGVHWAIFGLNGSGKTTLLSILAGYAAFTSGKLEIFGKEYNNDNLLKIRKKIGLVSTSFFDKFYKEESAMEIVLSGVLGTFGLDFSIKDEDVIFAKHLLSIMGLADKVNQSYISMSKGERQNVLIARSLIAQPEILILDEPCSGLDLLARDRVLNKVEEIAAKGEATLIYVTHYSDEILDCFKNTLLLRGGKIYKQGNTKDIFTDECLSNFLNAAVTLGENKSNRIMLRDAACQRIF